MAGQKLVTCLWYELSFAVSGTAALQRRCGPQGCHFGSRSRVRPTFQGPAGAVAVAPTSDNAKGQGQDWYRGKRPRHYLVPPTPAARASERLPASSSARSDNYSQLMTSECADPSLRVTRSKPEVVINSLVLNADAAKHLSIYRIGSLLRLSTAGAA